MSKNPLLNAGSREKHLCVMELVGPRSLPCSQHRPHLPWGTNSPFGCPPSETVTTDADRGSPSWCWLRGPPLLTVPVAGPFDTPWSVAFLPDGAFLVTERIGRLQLIRPGAEARPVSGVPVVLTAGQGGLLDVAVDLDFATNNIVYLSYLSGQRGRLYHPRAPGQAERVERDAHRAEGHFREFARGKA